MSTIVTRSGKGSPLTHNEVDTNFTNLNTDKVEKTNAAITGGTIDNTVIGGTTPAAGTFTTLTATGQTSLGGTTTTDVVRIYRNNTVTSDTASFTAPALSFIPPQAGFGAGILRSSAQLNISTGTTGSIVLQTAATLGFGGTTQAQIAHTASAVNYVQVTGGATGANPVISMQGSDSTISGQINTKGAGAFSFYNNGGGNRQLRIDGSISAVNFLGITGAVSGNSPILSAAGQSSDTNVGLVLQSKGTGAIDLAAGSSGVNISNGGTVTAITRTGQGSGYTSIPSVAISAPTTAGGVQATATANLFTGTSFVVTSGGTGYAVNDVVTLVGGTPTGSAATVTVSAVSGGVVTAVTAGNFGAYSSLPPSPTSVTGGSGTGLTLTIQYGFQNVTITNAGSGYVEQPTVSFSGGGGSGAAAYATVGSATAVKSLGTSISFSTPAGVQLIVNDGGGDGGNYWRIQGGASTAGVQLLANGSGTNVPALYSTKGTSGHNFYTNTFAQTQLVVSHTASAVNYVQVTGAATGSFASISAQGSDAVTGLGITSKGAARINFFNNNGTNRQVSIGGNGAAAVNYLDLNGSATGVAPSIGVAGSDTNIDLTLTPKGTGNVRFGTYTANMALTVQGYIEIKDSGGTVRKLAVIA